MTTRPEWITDSEAAQLVVVTYVQWQDLKGVRSRIRHAIRKGELKSKLGPVPGFEADAESTTPTTRYVRRDEILRMFVELPNWGRPDTVDFSVTELGRAITTVAHAACENLRTWAGDGKIRIDDAKNEFRRFMGRHDDKVWTIAWALFPEERKHKPGKKGEGKKKKAAALKPPPPAR